METSKVPVPKAPFISTEFKRIRFEFRALTINTEVAVYHHDQPLPLGFVEVAVVGKDVCDYGCKVYWNARLNHYAVAHNSAYGCRS